MATRLLQQQDDATTRAHQFVEPADCACAPQHTVQHNVLQHNNKFQQSFPFPFSLFGDALALGEAQLRELESKPGFATILLRLSAAPPTGQYNYVPLFCENIYIRLIFNLLLLLSFSFQNLLTSPLLIEPSMSFSYI